MSAREVMREALCLSFYGTDWTNTSDFRRRICDNMARDGLAALSAAGLAVVPVEPTEAEWQRAMDESGTSEGSLWEMRARGMYPELVRAMIAAAQEGDK